MENIDGYQIFAELKDGPVNTIYKALDLRQQQIVLIKLLHVSAEAGHWHSQFVQESKISMRLAHTNLRRTLHAGMHDARPYLVLEYVEGPTLYELIDRHHKLPIDLCIFIAKEIAQAIAAVHRYKVLHNDVKPQNIFISFNGAVKLGDLGLARELAESNPLVMGTPAYMSPEYILGQKIDEASDLFSFGAVLYEIITGEVAFIDRTLAATLLQVANWDPVSITRLRPDVPEPLMNICHKLLAKNPVERYREAAAVLRDLTHLERRAGLNTNAQKLATFLEAPDAYPKVNLQFLKAEPVAPKRARASFSMPNWGLLAILSATMFFAGVLFIKVLKDFMFEGTHARYSNTAESTSSIPLDRGYLDLRATPGSAIFINGDSVGTTPLAGLLVLPVGVYEVKVKSAQLGGNKSERIQISNGDTLRQYFDLTKP